MQLEQLHEQNQFLFHHPFLQLWKPITSETENEENSLEEKLILSDNDVNTSGDESNGLENFNLGAEDPQLFDETQSINSDHETNVNEDSNSDEEDELEIPAFLRRQKN